MKKILSLLSVMAFLGAGCIVPLPSKQPSQPSAAMPEPPKPEMGFVGCTPKSATVVEPSVGATVKLPLNVTLRVHNAEHPDCRWTVFEAQAASMRLLDKDGVTVGTGWLTTDSDWMTDDAVDYKGQIPDIALVEGATTLVITEENPSGQGTPQEISAPLTVTH